MIDILRNLIAGIKNVWGVIIFIAISQTFFAFNMVPENEWSICTRIIFIILSTIGIAHGFLFVDKYSYYSYLDHDGIYGYSGVLIPTILIYIIMLFNRVNWFQYIILCLYTQFIFNLLYFYTKTHK